MRALVIWGGFTLCLLLVAGAWGDPQHGGAEEGLAALGDVTGSQDGGRRRKSGARLVDVLSVPEAPATPTRRKTCPGCFSSLMVNDEAVAERGRHRKPHRHRHGKEQKPRTTQIGRSLLPPMEGEEPQIPGCRPHDTPTDWQRSDGSSMQRSRERRSKTSGKSSKNPRKAPPLASQYGPLRQRKHTEDKHSRRRKNGKRRGEERRGRKTEKECQPTEEDSLMSALPEFLPREEKEKRRSHGRERGQRGSWRSGSRSAITSVRNTETSDGDGKVEAELSRKRRHNRNGQKKKPRPGWSSGIASVKQGKFIV